MALQTANYISGKMGNIIFYERSGRFFAKSMPAKVSQTVATKTRSVNFGIASATGKTLRHLLLPVLPFPKDRKMQNRFAGVIAKWLQLSSIAALQPRDDVPFVNHFDFNESTGFAERFKVSISVTQPSANLIEVHIPAFRPDDAITTPANTTTVEFVVTAAACSLKDGLSSGSFTAKLNIPYNHKLTGAQILSLQVPTDKGTVVITAASLSYILAGQKKSISRRFMPASVIDARYL
jgi:hypothetical protein